MLLIATWAIWTPAGWATCLFELHIEAGEDGVCATWLPSGRLCWAWRRAVVRRRPSIHLSCASCTWAWDISTEFKSQIKPKPR